MFVVALGGNDTGGTSGVQNGETDWRFLISVIVAAFSLITGGFFFWLKENLAKRHESEIREIEERHRIELEQRKASQDADVTEKLNEYVTLKRHLQSFYQEIRQSFVKVGCAVLRIEEPHTPKILDALLCEQGAKCARLAHLIREFGARHQSLFAGTPMESSEELKYTYLIARIFLLESIHNKTIEESEDVLETLLDKHRQLAEKFPEHIRDNFLLRANLKKQIGHSRFLDGRVAEEHYKTAIALYDEALRSSRERVDPDYDWPPAVSGKVSILETMYVHYNNSQYFGLLINYATNRCDRMLPITNRLEDVAPILDHANLAECLIMSGRLDEANVVLAKTLKWLADHEAEISTMSPHENQQVLFSVIHGLQVYARILARLSDPKPVAAKEVEELDKEIERYRLRTYAYSSKLTQIAYEVFSVKSFYDNHMFSVHRTAFADLKDNVSKELDTLLNQPFSGPKALLKHLGTSILKARAFEDLEIIKVEVPKKIG
ncbi:MAG: hypothetical protein NT028_11485 [candidate division Zixibacteria bacterium]|nr:hypothetical protein [candidate division Zixibacteria bacterium]